MLEPESHGTGWQVTLRAKGFARFFAAGFLGFWLCGWAVGEFFAGTTLIAGLRDWLLPDADLGWLPRMAYPSKSSPAPVIAFLLVWLTGWTVGGAFAMFTLLRALVGVDRVRWDQDGLEVVQHAGPFFTRRREPWAELIGLAVRRRQRIQAETRKGLWIVTGMGSEDERRELGDTLSAAWRASAGASRGRRADAEGAPAGWTIDTAEDGRPMLRGRKGARRIGGALAGALALTLGLVAASITLAAGGVGPWIGAAVLLLFGLAAAALGAWLLLGEEELRPSHRVLRRVRRFLGHEWILELTEIRLTLESSRDSDGDERWELVARGGAGKLTLASDLHVPGAARAMGLWIAERTGVELGGLPEDDDRREAS